jgi:hypothetical protein
MVKVVTIMTMTIMIINVLFMIEMVTRRLWATESNPVIINTYETSVVH